MMESRQGSNLGQLSTTKQNESSRGPVLLTALYAQLMHFVTVKVAHSGKARAWMQSMFASAPWLCFAKHYILSPCSLQR